VERKRRLLIFHQALAPYRVDLWNSLNEVYDLKLFFIYDNHLDQKFDQNKLKSLLNFTPGYLDQGFSLGTRALRWGFRSLIEQFNPDVVFSYEYSQTTTSLYLIKKIFGFNYLLYSICDDSLHIAQNCSGLRKRFRNFLVPKLNGLVLVNKEVADWYLNYFPKKITTITFPIIAKEKHFRRGLELALPVSNRYIKDYQLTNKRCIIFIGRLVPVKGIDRLIAAFKAVSSHLDDVRLIIVGEGEQHDSLLKLVSDCDLKEQVIFPGRFEGDGLKAWYNLAQIFVLPSHYEPFGAVVNEALMAGAFVICSTFAGASSLISPNVNGNVFSPYDTKLLTELMLAQLQLTAPINKLTEINSSKMLVSYKELFSNFASVLDMEISNVTM
jgi:glycosyltransferase involved in cell wall biosynthesis